MVGDHDALRIPGCAGDAHDEARILASHCDVDAIGARSSDDRLGCDGTGVGSPSSTTRLEMPACCADNVVTSASADLLLTKTPA
jgi:hypothetical protein